MIRSALFARLARNRRGVAFIEFALALPMFIGVTLVGLEVAWMALAQQKVNQLAALTADNAARVTGSIDETSITEIAEAARLNGEKLDFMDNGRLVISSIQLNEPRNGQWIRWQRCVGKRPLASRYGVEGKGRTTAVLDGIGTKAPKMKAGAGSAIIVAEVEYLYQPLIGEGFQEPKIMRAETAFVVRQRTDLGITNITNMANSKKLTC